jgi:3-phenylpropionate/trans-cinnamate dioxygenase ferredoxin subunit
LARNAQHGRLVDRLRRRPSVRVCHRVTVAVGEAVRISEGPWAIAVFNVDGHLFAIDDTCTHQDASLSEGWLEGCTIECPLHASRFDLRTGQPIGPPATRAVSTYPVWAQSGEIWLELPDGPGPG